MRVLFGVLASIFVVASYGFERGGVDGGGGNAVVCRDENKKIISARMLDLFEGEILYDLEFVPFEGSINKKIDELNKMIIGTNPIGSYPSPPIANASKYFKFLPKGVALRPVDDSRHIFIPYDCKVEQVAHSYAADRIYIVTDIYEKFSELDKLALVLHESIYSLEKRLYFKENSRYARRIVSHLASKDFQPENIFKGIMGGPGQYMCSTRIPDGKRNHTLFWAYKENEMWVLQFIILNGHNVYSKKTVSFEDASQPGGPVHFFMSTRSLITGKDTISITMPNGKFEPERAIEGDLRISWEGFDPGERFDDLKFDCTVLAE